MRVKPILFSGEMVRALFDGRKTQTRRIVNPQPYFEAYGRKFETEAERHQIVASNSAGNWFWKGCCYGVCPGTEGHGLKYPGIIHRCPYGKPGDLLWVRESIRRVHHITNEPVYRADIPNDVAKAFAWRPSIHMPRMANRITLELTGIRVERLQDISEEDALADGGWRYSNCPFHKAPVKSFQQLWDSINAKRGYGWELNLWVWVLQFKVHKMNVDQFLREAA